MDDEHAIVVRFIADNQKLIYTVLVNTDSDENNKKYVFEVVPDIVLIDKTSGNPVFIIEVKKNGNIGTCLDQWKSVSSPITLYLIVPEKDINTAKSLAILKNVKAKFGTYKVNGTDVSVSYE